MTAREALANLEHRFSDCGIESPQINARILVSFVLGVELGQLALHHDDEIAGDSLLELKRLAARREAGEPLQYVIGSAPFRCLELETRPGVFIPRPETEVVVQAALDRIADVRIPQVLDLCCGSGTIAISIASERSDAQVTAVDVSLEAVLLAQHNAEKAGVENRVRVIPGDLLTALGKAEAGSASEGESTTGDGSSPASGSFDLVVSNPPYIPTAKLAVMSSEVTAWEPRLALDGGDDGLVVFRRIVAGLGAHLRPGGWFVCELDEDMVCEATRLLEDDGRFAGIAQIDDLAGRPRAVAARMAQRA